MMEAIRSLATSPSVAGERYVHQLGFTGSRRMGAEGDEERERHEIKLCVTHPVVVQGYYCYRGRVKLGDIHE